MIISSDTGSGSDTTMWYSEYSDTTIVILECDIIGHKRRHNSFSWNVDRPYDFITLMLTVSVFDNATLYNMILM